jgi:hypothetical protein
MTNIIGPISLDHWRTMTMLKESIKWMATKVHSNPKFATAIEKEKSLYRYFLEKYL